MSFTISEILNLMAVILFFIGLLLCIAGVIVLLIRTRNKDIQTLAVQTNRLAQKGIMEGVAGLVGNASSLLDATNQLVRTTTGIGVFLVITGFLLIGTAILVLVRLI